MTQTGDPSTEVINPGPQDNYRPRSPMRSSFGKRRPWKADQPVHDDLARPFQRLDHSERGAKDDRTFAIMEPAKAIRNRSSSSGECSSPRYELYRFDRRGVDWTIADRVSMNLPQNDIQQKVMKGKHRANIANKLGAMQYLRRHHIDRLLDQKNQVEKDKDVEWVPVLIETRKWIGISIGAFDVVIARTFRSTKRPSFADDKSDLRDPMESKESIANRQRGPQSPVHDKTRETKLVTDEGMPTNEGTTTNDARPLEIRRNIKISELEPFDKQRLFALKDGLTRPFDVNVHNLDVSDRRRLSNNQGRKNNYHRPNNSNSMVDLEARKLDYFGDERHFGDSRRAIAVESNSNKIDWRSTVMENRPVDAYGGPKDTKGQNINISGHKRVVDDEICITQDSLPEDSTQPPISGKTQSRPHPTISRPNIGYDLHAVEGERSPMIGSTADQIDIGRPFGMSFIFPHSRADSAYYSASDNMSSRCESVSPVMSRKRECRPPLEHDRAFDDGQQPSSSSIAPKHYVVDLVALRRPIAPTSPINSKAQNYPAMQRSGPVAGNDDAHVWKKVRAINAETPLRMPTAPAIPASSVKASLPLRPKNEKTSSFRCLSPKSETGLEIAMTEPTASTAEHSAYYCSIRGCIYSPNPGLCDLGPPIARRIHDSEAHKIYVLNGLPEMDLVAHVQEDHKEEIEDCRFEDLAEQHIWRQKPSVAEEQRFAVASEIFPGACAWLMRTRVADGDWSDWMGVDYDIVAASGFTPWGQDLSIDVAQPSTSNASPSDMVDVVRGAGLKSDDSLHVSAGENRALGDNLLDDVLDEPRPTKVEPAHDGSSSARPKISQQENTQNYADTQQRVPTLQPSVEADCGPHTPSSESFQSLGGLESPSQHETPSDDKFGNDTSIGVHTQESSTSQCSSASGEIRYLSENSGRTSSSDGAKSSCSVDQVSEAPSSISAGKKRAQDRDPLSEDEDDGSQKRHKRSLLTPSTTPARLLACPFHKRDPKTYNQSNEAQRMAHKFRTCGGPGWPTVARLKEHLYRVHVIPFQCHRCWLTMKTEQELQDHSRAEVPCAVLPQLVQWVPRDKIEVLKDRKKALSGKDEEDRWKLVYGVLFPNDSVIPSPYYDNLEERAPYNTQATSSSADIAALEQYAQETLPSRVFDAVGALPIESLKESLPEVIRACQAQIFKDWALLKSGSSVDTSQGVVVSQNHDTEQAVDQETHGEQQSAPGSSAWDESLSAFYIESMPAQIDQAFDTPLPPFDNGEGPSSQTRTRPDSGYDSLSQYPNCLDGEYPPSPTPVGAATVDTTMRLFREDTADPGASEVDLSEDSWGPFLSNPYQCPPHHHSPGGSCRECGTAHHAD